LKLVLGTIITGSAIWQLSVWLDTVDLRLCREQNKASLLWLALPLYPLHDRWMDFSWSLSANDRHFYSFVRTYFFTYIKVSFPVPRCHWFYKPKYMPLCVCVHCTTSGWLSRRIFVNPQPLQNF